MKTLSRRTVLLAAATWPAAAIAQAQAPAPRKIGFIRLERPGADDLAWFALRDGLAELGYVEGRDIAIERRYAMGAQVRLPRLAAELAEARVALVRAHGSEATLAMRRASPSIPIVATMEDPVHASVVPSLERPGGTVTGISLTAPAVVAARRFDLLREAAPDMRDAAFLWDANSAASSAELAVLQRAAASASMTLRSVPLRAEEEVERALAGLAAAPAGGLLLDGSVMLGVTGGVIAEFAAERKLPTVSGRTDFVRDGGLLAYGVDFAAVFRRTAVFVDRILKGADPASLPMEEPTQFRLAVGLTTAKEIGLSLSAALVARADHTVE